MALVDLSWQDVISAAENMSKQAVTPFPFVLSKQIGKNNTTYIYKQQRRARGTVIPFGFFLPEQLIATMVPPPMVSPFIVKAHLFARVPLEEG